MNLAARAGRWSAAHRKAATAAWLVLVGAAIAGGSVVGTQKLTNAEVAPGETARAEQILARAGFETKAYENVIVESPTLTVDDPAFRATVAEVVSSLRRMPQVENLRTGGAGQISQDRHAQLVQFDMKGDAETAAARVQPLLDAVARVQASHPELTVAEFGIASADRAVEDALGRDFTRAETLSLPITFLILLLAFGAFVAAGVPVLLAFSAVLGSLGLLALLSQVMHAADATRSVILLIGMAVGVDYSLFYLKREREERAAGSTPHGALHRAAATSGQAVLISGVTVLIGMAGLLFTGLNVFTSIGLGAMIVVFTTLVGSLTVLPALLATLGDRVEYGVRQVAAAGVLRAVRPLGRPRPLVRLRDAPTLLRRLKGGHHESRLWGAVLDRSLRFPRLAVAVSTALLLVLAVPVLSMKTRLPTFADLPKSVPIVATYDTMRASFPGSEHPAHVVVEGRDVTAPPFREAFAELRRRALATGLVYQPVRIAVNPARTVARIDLPLAGTGQDATSVRALETLRTEVIPPVLATLPAGTQAPVTGETAGTHDFNETLRARTPLVFAFVLGLGFLLLLVAFRSIVVPLKAIVLNLLSVAAAYGVVVWIFQNGHLQGLLDFESNGAVVSWLPLFVFTIMFGLSMDYHVFILSRVKELVDSGVPTDEAVARAIRATASTVTAAAAVMVAVFAIFASLRMLDMKQMGVGLAVAVLLDATLVRGVLLPAAMKLLGEWNWYLPRRLEWLPHLSAETEPRAKEPERPAALPALE